MGKVVSLYGGKDPRELPTYGIGEAAVYLGVPRSTRPTWVRGQRVRGRMRMRLPLRLYPWRREPVEPRIIALDPRRSFGRPTVVGSAVSVIGML